MRIWRDDFIDQLYDLIVGKRADYINPNENGSVIWRSIQSVDEDSEANFDNWQQGRYEISLGALRNYQSNKVDWNGNQGVSNIQWYLRYAHFSH
jgi:hypothetical protein